MVTLKSPAFGSSVEIVTNTLTSRTSGGKVNSIKGIYWYNARIFNWKFHSISKTNLDAFIAFAKTNAALQVTLKDEFGTDRVGIIHSEISYQQTDSNCDLYDLEFVFEGVAE